MLQSSRDDNAWSKRLSISHLDDIGLYMATTEDLPNLIRAVKSFAKSPNKPAPFPATIFHTKGKTFLSELWAMFVDYRTDSTSKFVELLNMPMPICRQ